MTLNIGENKKMTHEIDYINGFESLINEYKQDGRPSSPEAIYTHTTLKLNGFSSDSVVGSEGFISDLGKKFWQAVLAIYNWFKSLFKANDERKLDATQKVLEDTIKKIKKVDPNHEIIDGIVSEHYKNRSTTFINKLTYPLPINDPDKTPTPSSLLKYLESELTSISDAIRDSDVKELTHLSMELIRLYTDVYALRASKLYKELDDTHNTSKSLDLMALLPEAIKAAIKLRRQCDLAIIPALNTIKNNSLLLNNELYKRYSRIQTLLVKNVVKIQNTLIDESIYILKLISKHPAFKEIDFTPLIDDKVKSLIVEDTVRDLA